MDFFGGWLRPFFGFLFLASSFASLSANAQFAPANVADSYVLFDSISSHLDVNRDGSPDIIGQSLFGLNAMVSVDEDGAFIGNYYGPTLGAVTGVSGFPMPIGFAGGKLDGDQYEDLIMVTDRGSIHFAKNLGSSVLTSINFSPTQQIDLITGMPLNPPFILFSVPVIKILDFDGDGNNDVMIMASNIDIWGATTLDTTLRFYKGDGAGNFQLFTQSITGNVIDAEFADLDNDGTKETWVSLIENGSALQNSYSYDIYHTNFSQNQLNFVGFPQNLQFQKLTSLEIADVIGDSNADYIFSSITGGSSPGTRSGAVFYYAGDGNGNVIQSQWGSLNLPANMTGLSDYVFSIQVEDFNQDQKADIAVLRNYGLLQGSVINSQASLWADSDVIVFHGDPITGGWNYSQPAVHTLASRAYETFSSDFHLFLKPYRSKPDLLTVFDLGSNSTPDLYVAAARNSNPGPQTPMSASLKNTTPALPGKANLVKMGEANGANPAHKARLGFDGGKPTLGNQNFKATLSNFRGNQITTLMWGSYGQNSIFNLHGVDFHIVPEQFGYWGVSSGQGPDGGHFEYDLPIPNNPSLIGDAGYFQYLYWDNVENKFGISQGTQLFIGN